MAQRIWLAVLVAVAVGAGGVVGAADPVTGKQGGKAGDTGACYFESTAACWEKYTPLLCSGESFSPGAACPTSGRVGTCTTSDGRVARFYKKLYTAETAAGYCTALSGKFEPG